MPERTGWKETSPHADVLAFLSQLDRLDHAERLVRFTFGATNEGREMVAVLVADPPARAPEEVRGRGTFRILINGNIHGGEVEGKEAIQLLLREFASGEHRGLLEHVTLLFVPDFNADGNDRIDPHHRATQNGPDGGVGERENAQGLDLNRDFLKLESPECRGMLDLVRRFDPHLFLDLHTTNGSYHGYHLTYSPSLSTNVDDEIDAFARGTMIPAIRGEMARRHRWRIFDYGNFQGQGDERSWATYDHRPRFGTNYFGLRGRFSLLSEAYSYLPFEERVAVTRDFVLETLRFAAREGEEMASICARVDARRGSGEGVFRYDTELAPPVAGTVLVGAIEEVQLPGDQGTRRVALPVAEAEPMGIQDSFRSRSADPLPEAWAVPEPPDGLAGLLQRHGIRFRLLPATEEMWVRAFDLSHIERAEAPYQGHRECRPVGSFGARELRRLPSGTLLVPSAQPLAVLAAQLLDPRSEDSLFTWDLFEGLLDPAACPCEFPVLRVSPG